MTAHPTDISPVKPKRRPARIPVSEAFQAFVDAGIDPARIVIDTVNHRVFVKSDSLGHTLADGAKTDWSEAIRL
jgi:hypothetical protein